MADEPNLRRRGTILVIVLVLLSLLPLYDHYGHPVRVYDGSTGEPLEGAFAVGRWGARSLASFVQSSSVCYKLVVARTGEDGTLYMPKWSWSGRALMLHHGGHFFSGGGYILYRPGYFEGPREANPPGQRIMWPDPRTAMDRLRAINFDQRRTECLQFDSTQYIIQLAPMYEAMVEEAEALAKTPDERIERDEICWWRNYLLFGSKVATEMSRREREREKKK